MKKNTMMLILVSLIACFLIFACINPMGGGEEDVEEGKGVITISIGGKSARTVVSWAETLDSDNLIHTITVSGGPGTAPAPQTIYPGDGKAQFSVTPGQWTITVEGSLASGEVVAVGSQSKQINQGDNGTITIQMQKPASFSSYTVRFNSNGGSSVPSQTVNKYSKAQSVTPSRSGFGFAGWYRDSYLTELYDFNAAVTSDFALYADWSTNFYTVTFIDNGTTVHTQNIAYNLFASDDVTKTGYTGAWYKEPAFTNLWNFSSDAVVGNMSLYVKWTANTYYVFFNDNPGSGGPSTQVIAAYDQPMPAIPSSPTRAGYTFNGYFDAASGGKKYYNADKTSAANWDKETDFTLLAQWTANTVTIKAVPGVTVPVVGANPVSAITATTQYTGTVTWDNGNPGTFAGSTVYTATITLTAINNYTMDEVVANSFTVAGATSVSNVANSGVITATFPATADAVVSISAIAGVTVPVTGAAPATPAIDTTEYTGTVAWLPNDTAFAPGTAYTATITLTAKTGYTFTGVAANFFTVAGASPVTNSADSGVITAVFSATGKVNQAALSITNPGTKTYGDASFTLGTTGGSGSGAVSYTLMAHGDGAISLSGSNVTIVKAGSDQVYATKAGDSSYNSIDSSPITITVGKASLTISTTETPKLTPIPSTASIDYVKTAAPTITVSGLVGSDTITVGVDSNSYGLTGSKSGMTNGSNASTNNLTLTYNGITQVSAITSQTVGLTISGNDNYTLSGSPTISVTIYDGQDPARPIPVTDANFTDFGTYARSSPGDARHYKLNENITLTSSWMPIGGDSGIVFKGSFNGDGKTIDLGTNLVGKDGRTAGLFGCVDVGGEIKNLKLTGSISVSHDNQFFVGAVAGWNNGTIMNVSSSVNVTGSTTGVFVLIGGIVGYNFGPIKNCYSTGNITVTSAPDARAGGIVGSNVYTNDGHAGDIRYSWASGNITGNAAGAVLTEASVGGISGDLQGGASFPANISNCVALNTTLSGTGSTVKLYRITWSPNPYDTIANNYANSSMVASGGPFTGDIGLGRQDGQDVLISATEAGSGSWWNSTAGWTTGTVWGGTDDDHPWKWPTSGVTQRPVLWFETEVNQ